VLAGNRLEVGAALPGGSVSMDQKTPNIWPASLPLLMAVTCEHNWGRPVSASEGVNAPTVIVQPPWLPWLSVPPLLLH